MSMMMMNMLVMLSHQYLFNLQIICLKKAQAGNGFYQEDCQHAVCGLWPSCRQIHPNSDTMALNQPQIRMISDLSCLSYIGQLFQNPSPQ